MSRRLPFFRTLLGLSLALLASVALVLFVVRIERVATAQGQLEGGTVSVRAPRSGIIAEVPVQLAQSVERGQVLLRFLTDDLAAERSQTLAHIALLDEQLSNLGAEKSRLEGRVHPAEVMQATRGIERAEIKRTSYQERAEIFTRLKDESLVNVIEAQDALLDRKLAQADAVVARDAGDLLALRHKARIEALEGELREHVQRREEARAALAEHDRKLAESVVLAPRAGSVIADNLEELKGRSIQAGEEFMRLSSEAPRRFVGFLEDASRSKVEVGDPTSIRLQAYPWLLHGVLEGSVESISERRSAGGGFMIHIALFDEPSPGPLFEGLSGEARIRVDQEVSLGTLLIEKLVGPGER